MTEVESCLSYLTTEGTDLGSTIKSSTSSRDTELRKARMHRVSRSVRNISLGRHRVGLVINGKAGLARIARSSRDWGLSGHSIGLVIGGKAGLARVSWSSGNWSLSRHGI